MLQHVATTQTNVLYENMMNAELTGDIKSANLQAIDLKKNYESTPYAKDAALLLAKNDVATNKLKSASQQLTWVMKNASLKAMQQTARLRLARIDIAEGQASRALNLLKITGDENFKALTYEVKGDAYHQLKEYSKAKQAYQSALAQSQNIKRPILQMKLDALKTRT